MNLTTLRVLGTISLFGILAGCGAKTDTKTPEYEPARVTRKTVRVTVSASGSINPWRQIEIKSKASGTIIKLGAEAGDRVQNGQLLAMLDKTDETTKLNQIKANVISAQAKVDQAHEILKQSKRALLQQQAMASGNLTAQDAVFAAQTQFRLNQSNLTIAQAALMNAREQHKSALNSYRDTEIHAPSSGVILDRLVEEGNVISSGLSAANGGTLLYHLGDLSRLLVKADVDEVDIPNVRAGQTAQVTADAFPDRTFDAKVTQVAPMATTVANVTVYAIQAEITDPDRADLKPGMSAALEIQIKAVPDALTVPSDAIIVRRGKRFVMVKNGKEYRRQAVKTGATNDTDTQILSGVEEGDTVYIRKTAGNGPSMGSGQGRNPRRPGGMGMMMGGH